MDFTDKTFSDVIFRSIPNLQPGQWYGMSFGIFIPITFKVISLELSKGMGECWDEACPIATISFTHPDSGNRIERINLNKYKDVYFTDSKGKKVETVTNISYFKLSDYARELDMRPDMRNEKSNVIFTFVSEDNILSFSEIIADSKGITIKSDFKSR